MKFTTKGNEILRLVLFQFIHVDLTSLNFTETMLKFTIGRKNKLSQIYLGGRFFDVPRHLHYLTFQLFDFQCT